MFGEYTGVPTRIAGYSGNPSCYVTYQIHWQVPFGNIAKRLGTMNATKSALEQVFHNHHGIFRHKATCKPFLNAEYMEDQLVFAHMAIAVNHIVFTDKMFEFNSIRGAFNKPQKRTLDPNQWAIHDKEISTIRVIFWTAICMRPYHMWEQETGWAIRLWKMG